MSHDFPLYLMICYSEVKGSHFPPNELCFLIGSIQGSWNLGTIQQTSPVPPVWRRITVIKDAWATDSVLIQKQALNQLLKTKSVTFHHRLHFRSRKTSYSSAPTEIQIFRLGTSLVFNFTLICMIVPAITLKTKNINLMGAMGERGNDQGQQGR